MEVRVDAYMHEHIFSHVWDEYVHIYVKFIFFSYVYVYVFIYVWKPVMHTERRDTEID